MTHPVGRQSGSSFRKDEHRGAQRPSRRRCARRQSRAAQPRLGGSSLASRLEQLETRKLLSFGPVSPLMPQRVTAAESAGNATMVATDGNDIFFTTNLTQTDPTTGDETSGQAELWATDGNKAVSLGTYADTYAAAGYAGNGSPLYFYYDPLASFTVVGDKVVYEVAVGQVDSLSGADYSAPESQLWSTDGTAAGTEKLADFNGHITTDFASLLVVGTSAYFGVEDAAGDDGQIWTSDGTAGGTQMVADLGNVGPPETGIVLPATTSGSGASRQVLFSANLTQTDPTTGDETSGQAELWATDGKKAVSLGTYTDTYAVYAGGLADRECRHRFRHRQHHQRFLQ